LKGKNVSKCFFSETSWTVETKLPRNDHWKVIYKRSMIIPGQFGFNCPSGFREEAF
jgi:hypothetical protein